MKKYLVRAGKYAVKLVVLLAIVFWLMRASGSLADASIPFWETMRGRLFLGAVVLWVAIYPAVEYVRREMLYTLGRHRKAITAALAAGGYELLRETEGEMVFCARNTLRRILWLGEDKITIRGSGSGIIIEGPRRFTAEAVQRIPMYVEKVES